MDSDIVKAEIMMEGIGPELGRKTGTTKHSTKSITNGLMGMFTRAVLMRGVRSRSFKTISSIFKQVHHIATSSKIATKVKANILIREVNRETMLGKPAIQKVNGRSLGTKSLTIQSATVMIRDKAITSFTIEALKTSNTSRVFGALDHETKVNRETLVACGSMARVSQTTGSFAKFGLNTNGTGIQIRSKRKRGNTNGMFV
jgi:hypothetical protein